VERVNRRREQPDAEELDTGVLRWISDRELLMFVERLPLGQRQVLMLRFLLDLNSLEIASILEMSPDQVRALQRRALAYLRERLDAIGRGPERGELIRMHRWRKQATVLRERRFALAR